MDDTLTIMSFIFHQICEYFLSSTCHYIHYIYFYSLNPLEAISQRSFFCYSLQLFYQHHSLVVLITSKTYQEMEQSIYDYFLQHQFQFSFSLLDDVQHLGLDQAKDNPLDTLIVY